MKKIFTFLVFFFMSFQGMYAMCLYEETDPVCAITGKTFRSTCEWWSDTSSWSIPTAYDGECHQTPELSIQQKDAVYTVVENFFESHDMIDTSRWSYRPLNREGQDFVRLKLFPKITEIIAEEIEKKSPNYTRIAFYNYLAQTIGYDYEIRQPK